MISSCVRGCCFLPMGSLAATLLKDLTASAIGVASPGRVSATKTGQITRMRTSGKGNWSGEVRFIPHYDTGIEKFLEEIDAALFQGEGPDEIYLWHYARPW